jgi:prepilin peptidase CpaA
MMVVHVLQVLLWTAALAALTASAWTDLKERIIPNRMVGWVAASGLGLSLVLRPDQIWIGLLAASFCIVALGTLAHVRVMGGGDVKLLSAATLLVPPGRIVELIVYTAIAGGMLSAAYLLARQIVRHREPALSCSLTAAGSAAGHPPETWRSREYARIAAHCPVPYAIAILGGVAGVLAGELHRCLYANSCSF